MDQVNNEEPSSGPPRYKGLSKVKQDKVHQRDGGKCRYCGQRSEVVDHVVPLRRGGSNDLENLAASCKRCNSKKGDRLLSELDADWAVRASRPSRNFAPMPLAVLASDASINAKMLILALCHHDWDGLRAWPSQDRLAKLMSVSTDTVGRATRECIQKGWITQQRRRNLTAIYDLNVPNLTIQQFEGMLSRKPQPAESGKPQPAGSGNRNLRDLDTAGCGTNESNEREPMNQREKDPLSSASLAPPTPQAALALMNPAFRAKHGVDLSPSDGPKAVEAWHVFHDDLVPAWQRYVADPGTRGKMDELRHPISIFKSQPQIWGTPPAAAGQDPAQKAAALAARARAEAEHRARADQDHAREEQLEGLWPRLPEKLRRQVLDQVASANDFVADLVKDCLQKRAGMLKAGSAVCTAVLELRPDILEASHA